MFETRLPDLPTRPPLAMAVLISVALSSFMVALDVTALNVALPVIGSELRAGMDVLQWIAGTYTLVFASLLLSAGALSDRLGARRVFLAALMVFTMASVACGLATDVALLIVARGVQGVGAALMLPSSMALLTEAFPERAARAKAVALWGAISAVALVVGPLAGGVLVEHAGWRSVFYLNVPFCLIALVCCVSSGSRLSGRRRTFDFAGQILSALSLAGLIFALIDGPVLGWMHPVIVVAMLSALVFGVVFVRLQRRLRDPMLPLDLFESRMFCAAVGAGFMQTLGYYGSLFVLPFALQQHGFAPVQVGVAMLPMTLATGVMASMSGRLSNRFGAHRVGGTGMLCGALGAALLSCSQANIPLVLGGLLIGLGGATLPVIVGACLTSLPASSVGIGSGVMNAARQCGGVTAIALLGAMLQSSDGVIGALWIIAVSFFGAALLTLRQLKPAVAYLPVSTEG